MKISKLLNCFQEKKTFYGDMEVFFGTADGNRIPTPNCHIHVENADENKRALFVVPEMTMLRNAANPIDEAVKLLTGLTQSGYIPFSSPCPSSTEKKLRNCITSAISLLEVAQGLESELGFKKTR